MNAIFQNRWKVVALFAVSIAILNYGRIMAFADTTFAGSVLADAKDGCLKDKAKCPESVGVLQAATTILSPTDLQNVHVTSVTVIAGVPGKIVRPVAVDIFLDYATTPYSAPEPTLSFAYKTYEGSNTIFTSSAGSNFFTAATDTWLNIPTPPEASFVYQPTDLAGTDITIKSDQAFVDGDSPVRFKLYYVLEDVTN